MGSDNVRSLSFSIELNSRGHIKRVSLPDGSGDRVTIEGSLGELDGTELIEDIMLVVRGTNGVLRMNLTREELEKTLRKGRIESTRVSAP
ncbi:MAG: hypothetical protein JSV27_00780 [Candidatus Bathyarchaeota archaeon]|nr:MAG: hypothetical protein JSV27_00780 [Candidatus Bathyarchaeota archaeon]